MHLDEMRRAVKNKFPDLCDDRKLCWHEHPKRPEWDHRLRDALYRLKKDKKISQTAAYKRTGWYTFP